MEDWKATQDVEISLEEKNRVWERTDSFASAHTGLHDESIHWKPDSNHSLEFSEGGHRFNFDDPDTFIQNVSEPMVTLMEEEACAEHVIKVWDEVSSFIVEKLKDGYAVKIAGLGTFTYAEQIKPGKSKLERLRVKRTPFMIVSEFVVRMYNLITPLHDTLSTLPMTQLNIPLIAKRTQLTRRIVDGVLTEVLQSFARALVCSKNLEFPFPNIGKLQVYNRKVIFKFYADFCTQLDLTSRHHSPIEEFVDSFILPGAMTPLRRHIPTHEFRSVFHLREVRSVHEDDLLAPVELVDGKYQVSSKMQNEHHPVYTLLEDTSQPIHFKMDQLYGPQLQKRYTISWVREKRDYLTPSKKPWPPHHYHVVESSVALPKRIGGGVEFDGSAAPLAALGRKSDFAPEISNVSRSSEHHQPRQSENFYQFYSRVSKNLRGPVGPNHGIGED